MESWKSRNGGTEKENICVAALQRGHFDSAEAILKSLEGCPQDIKDMNWAVLGEKWNGKLPLQSGEKKVALTYLQCICC